MRRIKKYFSILGSILKQWRYLTLTLLGSILLLGLIIILPVVFIPANDLAFQLSIFTPKDYALMATLSVLMSINFSVQIYAIRKRRSSCKISHSLAGSATGGASGILAGVLGTSSCGSCLIAIFGLVGFELSGVLLLLEYRTILLIISLIILLASLSYTLRAVKVQSQL